MQVPASSKDKFTLGPRDFSSRLILGSGKFASPELVGESIQAAESEMITVALRRVDFNEELATQDPIKAIDREKTLLLPNTAGARSAKEAVHLAQLARELGGGSWLKLEVTPEPRYLLPDPIETLKAATELVQDGFIVLPYIHADPVLALRLQDAGCAAVMPLGSPIGSRQGLVTAASISVIIEQAQVPVIVDAGIGAPSHAALAMEMGADAVLVNTAISVAQSPPKLARAFALAVQAGRTAFLYGQGRQVPKAVRALGVARASSPRDGIPSA